MRPLAVLAILALIVTVVRADDDFDIEDDVDEDEIMENLIDNPPEGMDDLDEEAPPAPPKERPLYSTPTLKGPAHFVATFESESDLKLAWVKSTAKKDGVDADIAKYEGVWAVEEPEDMALRGNLGLVLKSRAKHHAIAAKLDTPFAFTGKPFVVQYEVRFQNGQECGGAYIKLLTDDGSLTLEELMDKTPYTIMFGPDRCGNDNKLHFIFRHKNPLTGEFEEKHAKKPSSGIDTYFTDKQTHLFTLVVNPDNTWEVLVDQKLINSGSLLADMEPAVNPPKEIVDPDDTKPEDWDEREKIADPDAIKPEDWDESQPEKIVDTAATQPDGWLTDEPELVPDPDAEKPEDWDEDMDGEWEAPQINNPACEGAPGCGPWTPPMVKNPKFVGKWKTPMIDNPAYKGKWTARSVTNPAFFEDLEPYKMSSIGAVGLELWSMSDGILFDNFIVTDDRATADLWAADTWALTSAVEKSGAASVVDAVMDATKDKPWLWAVFVVVGGIPVILLIAYCCMGGSKEDEVARKKKTDEPTADAPPAEGETEEVLASEDCEDMEAEAACEEGGTEEEGEGDGGDEAPVEEEVTEAEPVKVAEAELVNGNAENGSGEFTEDDEEEDVVQTSPSPKTSPRRPKVPKE